jgi:ATP-dependent Lhr-like helicase
VPLTQVEDALERLLAAETVLRGEFRPGGAEREWCDPDVLRLLRRRSLARLRREVEPVEQTALARFLPAWHGIAPVGEARPSVTQQAALERLAEVVDQPTGVPIPASVLERDVLPARINGYQPRLLDEIGSMGEVAWAGQGSLGRDDGRIVLYRPGREALRMAGRSAAEPGGERPNGEPHEKIREHLARRGASFYRDIYAAAGGGTDREVLDALWDLVWRGRSRTTPLRRCARCAGSDPPATPDAGPGG